MTTKFSGLRRVGLAGGIAVLLAFLPRPAEGQQFRDWLVCGGNAFATCASVEVTVDAFNHVRMRVWNHSGLYDTWGGTVFTKIGFFNTGSASAVGSSLSMTGPTRDGDSPDEWTLEDSNNAGGIELELVGSANGGNSSVDNGLASACDPDELPGGANDLWQNPCWDGSSPMDDAGWVSLDFDITGNWDLAGSDVLIMGQNGPDDLSTQCITGENCSVVPEPITMALLASGLAGLAGAESARRRRREDEVESDA